jgi:peptidoglycan hydrolase-like protein with peptidoglycan-binding domain
MIEPLLVGGQTITPAIVAPKVQPTLRRGATGPAVKYVQTVLKERAGQDLTIDSKFGYSTEAAVKNLQRFVGMPVTGVVDVKTWSLLKFLAKPSTAKTSFDIAPYVLSMEVSLSLDAVSQLTITVADPELKLLAKNIFNLRRPITFLGMKFEIASCDVKQGSGGEEVRIEARNAACQKLKRDKTRANFTGGNGTVYAATKARGVGLKFFGEDAIEKTNISQVSSDNADESAWDVLKRIAGQNQFVMFESDGRLFFCSMQFLLGKFAVVAKGVKSGFFATPVRWLTDKEPDKVVPAIPGPADSPTLRKGSTGAHVTFIQKVLAQRAGQMVAADGKFGTSTYAAVRNLQAFIKVPITGVVDKTTWPVIRFLAKGQTIEDTSFRIKALECPACRKSDDDFNAATVSLQVEPDDGRQLRPGMTIQLPDMPEFSNNYIVTEVRWNEGTPDAVSITARTPVEPTDSKVAAKLAARVDLTGGGFSSSVVENAFA